MTGDYGQLLIRGSVVVRTADPGGWRKEMRDKARLDRLKIRTGTSAKDPDVAWALRVRADSPDEQELDASFKTVAYQHEVEAVAETRGHSFPRWIVNHEGRAAGRCQTCGARALVDITREMAVVDGEVLDLDCPGVWSPPDEP